MGSVLTATLAYGYNLGNIDDFKAAQRDQYGGPAPDWYDADSDVEFAVQLYDRLHAAAGLPAEANPDRRESVAIGHYGVEVAYCGTDAYNGWILIASGSEQEAHNADVLVLDLMALEHPDNAWFDRLVAAVEALGINPHQDWPRWLVYPSYG